MHFQITLTFDHVPDMVEFSSLTVCVSRVDPEWRVLSVYYDKNLLKICIRPLLVVCSLYVPNIIEFYLCIQMLPSKTRQKCKLASL